MNRNQSGFAYAFLIVAILVATAGFVGYRVISTDAAETPKTEETIEASNEEPDESDSTSISTYAECIEAGYGVPSLQAPIVCETPDGRTFTGEVSEE